MRLQFSFLYTKRPRSHWSTVFVLALPIFTCSRPHTIVGTHELNFCVRNGNRWTLMVIKTNFTSLDLRKKTMNELHSLFSCLTPCILPHQKALVKPIRYMENAAGVFLHLRTYFALVTPAGIEPTLTA